MNNISFEYWVILGLVGLYLFDSAKLISFNQVFLTGKFNQSFAVIVPSKQVSVFKKYLFLTFPFKTNTLLFSAYWYLQEKNIEKTLAAEILSLNQILKVLKKLRFTNFLVWFLTLMVFPILFLTQQNQIYLLIVIISIYTFNIFQIIYISLKRKRLGLTSKQCFYFLIDALFCPPFALNLLKKISLNKTIKSDAIELAKRLLTTENFHQFRQPILLDIQQLKQIELNNETTRFLQLDQLQRRLLGM